MTACLRLPERGKGAEGVRKGRLLAGRQDAPKPTAVLRTAGKAKAMAILNLAS